MANNTELNYPVHPLRELTPEEAEIYGPQGYVRAEDFPEDSPERSLGIRRFWTAKQLEERGQAIKGDHDQ